MNIENIKKMQLSLVNNFESIQTKIEKLMKNETLDIKQLSDLERYVNMQETVLDTLQLIERIVLGEI